MNARHARETANSDAAAPSGLAPLLGRIGIWATFVAAIVLSAVVIARGLIYLWRVPEVGVVALVTRTGPLVGLLLMTIAGYINYYGTWRIVRHRDRYNVREDLKSHAADVPAALARLGCLTTLIPLLYGTSLAATALTITPPAFPNGSTPPPAPTLTPTPLPERLSVTPPQATVLDCFPNAATVAYPTITIGNSGGRTLHWHASATDPSAMVSPASGALDPAQTQALSVTQPGPAHAATSVSITSDGGGGTVQFTCAPHVNLRVTQNQTFAESCNGTPASYAVTLDNSGSNVPVSWQFMPTEYSGSTPWATSEASSGGTLAAFTTGALQIRPQAWTCPAVGTSRVRHATLTLSFPQGGSQPNIALTDTIRGPALRANLRIAPPGYQNYTENYPCGGTDPAPYTFTLDNTGSNVLVSWQFVPTEYNGSIPWATASPSSGTVAAGGSSQVQISPQYGVCGTYHATLHLSFPQGGSQPDIALTATFTF
jgi:hypothetical protein